MRYIVSSFSCFYGLHSMIAFIGRRKKHLLTGSNSYMDIKLAYSRGHGRSKQRCISSLSPSPNAVQFLPPWSGNGSEQVRVRFLIPLPHDLLQMLHDDHGVYAPSTEEKKKRL